jgi:protein-S-isoprenylcysteine O-methyltransferase Ste14
MKLLINALLKYLLGLMLVSLLLFLPAGGFAYPNGWLFTALLFIPMLLLGVVLFVRSPELLKRRLDGKEKERAQRGVLAFSALLFPFAFLLSAFDFRFGWSRVPLPVVCIASALFLLGYGLYAEVMRENAYLSRTVKVEVGQTVISSGLYRIVRHPMYLSTLLMFLPMPLILGSYWGLAALLPYPALLVFRILNEEKLLCKELFGYTEYTARVRWRLLPFIW